jgi:hypothetical protein
MSSWVDGALGVAAEDAGPGRSPGRSDGAFFSKRPAASVRRLDDVMQKEPGKRGDESTIRAER